MNPQESELEYVFGETLPATGKTLEVAPGVRWLRMGLPFALNHINLWLLEDQRIQPDGSVQQGWTIVESERRSLAVAGGSVAREIPFTLLRVRREHLTPRGREVSPQLVGYFFVGADGVAGSHAEMVRRDVWNRVRHGRADRWAYVLLQTDAREGEPAALARMGEVLRDVWPVLSRAPEASPGQP